MVKFTTPEIFQRPTKETRFAHSVGMATRYTQMYRLQYYRSEFKMKH